MEEIETLKQQISDLLNRVANLEKERVGILHQHNGNDSSKIPFTSVTGAGAYGRFYDVAFAGIMTFTSEGITASESGVGVIAIGGAILPKAVTIEAVESIDINAPVITIQAGAGLYSGSGAPTLSAAQGSLYLRTDGSSTTTRAYINTNGSTGWTSVTTAA